MQQFCRCAEADVFNRAAVGQLERLGQLRTAELRTFVQSADRDIHITRQKKIVPRLRFEDAWLVNAVAIFAIQLLQHLHGGLILTRGFI